MIKQPNLYQWVWIGLFKISLTQNLKRLRCHLICVRRNAVGYFQSVHVSLVLNISTKSAKHRLSQKTENQNHQHYRRQRCPVVDIPDLPPIAPMAQNPVYDVITDKDQ